MVQIEQNLFRAVAGKSGCRLVNKIMPVGADVKGGEAVQLALDIRPRRVLLGHTLGKVDGHLGVDQAPVLTPSAPFFRNIHHSQIQHFQQTTISRKHRFGLGHLTQLAVKPLNGLGGVDQSAHLLGVLEIGAEIGLIGLPGLGDFWVFLVPARPKGVQSIQGCLLAHGGIDRLQIGHKGLQVLVGHILAGITQLGMMQFWISVWGKVA